MSKVVMLDTDYADRKGHLYINTDLLYYISIRQVRSDQYGTPQGIVQINLDKDIVTIFDGTLDEAKQLENRIVTLLNKSLTQQGKDSLHKVVAISDEYRVLYLCLPLVNRVKVTQVHDNDAAIEIHTGGNHFIIYWGGYEDAINKAQELVSNIETHKGN